ncbi:MAG: FkbM family methyltransferase [Acetobacteraceae bacterium]|nr:FkbM family methyltransferase [Acetobacteraceae bacterium]
MPRGESDPAAPQQRPRPGLLARLSDLRRPRRHLLPLSRLGAGLSAVQPMIRALAGGIPMAGGILLCRSLGRYKMLVDAADQSHAPHLLLDGYWEWWTTAFLARNLRPGETMVDAGAGYGYFTLLAADLVGPKGRVLAFEPHPRLAMLLRRNLTLNGFEERVELTQQALAAGSSPVRRLVVPPDAPPGARLEAEDSPEEDSYRPEVIITVTATSLDHLANRHPDLVKLDIPGSEQEAWTGMQRLLEANPAVRILMAFDPARCQEPAALLEQLALRFPLRRLIPDGRASDCSAAEILTGGESMLFLSRSAPA